MGLHFARRAGIAVVALLAAVAPAPAGDNGPPAAGLQTAEQLGEALFFDVNLSLNRTQSCATCHAPDLAHVDPREGKAGRAVSLGDDGVSLGDRNAPTAGYAAFTPPFGKARRAGLHRGGLFLDGRAATLEEQAGGPPLNPLEMGMPDKASVVARLKENPAYAEVMRRLFGPKVFADPDRAYAAMTRAIAAYERTPAFAPFDSKYDRYLRGELLLTEQEELGRVLFFSRQFTNCAVCHQLNAQGGTAGETFSNSEFHNIGVPPNPALVAAGAVKPGVVDLGLARNPKIRGKAGRGDAAGRFRTPSLRNVAVSGPYMHNGVFQDLRTVVLFYNTYNTQDPERKINPETGAPFAPPEVAQNISRTDLEIGPPLDDRRIDALVAFLKTLTDKRYEPLLEGPQRAAGAAPAR